MPGYGWVGIGKGSNSRGGQGPGGMGAMGDGKCEWNVCKKILTR